MEILEFVLGFLFFCGILATLAHFSTKGEDYTDYLRQEYGMHHEYHN